MTREEFNAKVMEQFNKYKEEMVAQSPERIFNCSYEITKMVALNDYLTGAGDWYIECLYPYADDILDELYDYEWNYDEAQWTNWDGINSMVSDFIDFIKEEN